MSNHTDPTSSQLQRADDILARIDHEAEQGWCSNWSDSEIVNGTLIVTMADNTVRRHSVGA